MSQQDIQFIVVSDQPGDLCSQAMQVLNSFAEVFIPESYDETVLGKLITKADGIITWGNTKLTPELLAYGSDRLRVISVTGIGYDNVDVPAATARGIKVCNTPGANAYAVAEYALAMIINTARNIIPASDVIKHKEWVLADRFTGTELRSKTVGIIALGNTGLSLAKLLQVFGCQVLGYDPYVSKERAHEAGVRLVSLEELCRQSDVILVHAPLTESTYHLLGPEVLPKVKRGAWIINCGRAPVVDEDFLVSLLQSGQIAGYATDVFLTEPPDLSKPLYSLDNVIATPHIAAMTDVAIINMQVYAAENIKAILLGGKPHNVVNP